MAELTLSDIGALAEIVGASTIITGLVFGWIQLRHYRTQQRDAIALSLAQTFYSRDLANAIALLLSVPDGIRLPELRAKGQAYEEAAVTVTTSFETMGILVFKRIAPLDLVGDLAGGIVTTMRRKLRNYTEDVRAEQSQPSWGEWFEWLGDRLEPLSKAPPAQIQHKGWRA